MKSINLQETFLNYLRKNNIFVTVFLTNGFQLKGLVKSYDKRKVFEPDFVKIDKSFANEEDLIHFQSLKSNYNVIVEGIETAEQLQKCRELGFQYVQGYYFSKPLTYEELSDKIDSKELEQEIQNKLSFEPSV